MAITLWGAGRDETITEEAGGNSYEDLTAAPVTLDFGKETLFSYSPAFWNGCSIPCASTSMAE